MSNRHYVLRPTDWLTPEGWAAIEPMIDAMPGDGGCVALVFDARPDIRNFLHLDAASFTKAERQALRKAIERCRAKREELS